jgi:hypothetical protein
MISVLFVAKNSVYKTLTDSTGEPLDCWDEDRNALNWPGGNPVVAHPPCAWWSRMRYLAKSRVEQKAFAPWAVDQVRQYGGVLEHPEDSSLWPFKNLPYPGERDEFGFCIMVPQFWFGHKARKNTWLYIVGTTLKELPPIPFKLGEATHTCGGGLSEKRKRNGVYKPSLWSRDRAATPVAFAKWLVETAERCKSPELVR